MTKLSKRHAGQRSGAPKARIVESDQLSALLDAGLRKYGEQVTAVFASTLRACPPFMAALFARLGVELEDEQSVPVATEVPTGLGRDAVDLQIVVLDRHGSFSRRVWIEVKIDDQLAAAQAESENRAARDPQLVRYRTALDQRDAQRPGTPQSVLALLALNKTERDRAQVEAAKAQMITWAWVADLACAIGRAQFGENWQRLAREPKSPLEQAGLEALVWFMDSAAPPDRREIPYLGVMGTEPMTSAGLESYGQAPLQVALLKEMLDRCKAHLASTDWQVVKDAEDDEGQKVDVDDDHNVRTMV